MMAKSGAGHATEQDEKVAADNAAIASSVGANLIDKDQTDMTIFKNPISELPASLHPDILHFMRSHPSLAAGGTNLPSHVEEQLLLLSKLLGMSPPLTSATKDLKGKLDDIAKDAYDINITFSKYPKLHEIHAAPMPQASSITKPAASLSQPVLKDSSKSKLEADIPVALTTKQAASHSSNDEIDENGEDDEFYDEFYDNCNEIASYVSGNCHQAAALQAVNNGNVAQNMASMFLDKAPPAPIRRTQAIKLPTKPEIDIPNDIDIQNKELLHSISESAFEVWIQMKIIRNICIQLEGVQSMDPLEQVNVHKSLSQMENKAAKFAKIKKDYSKELHKVKIILQFFSDHDQQYLRVIDATAKALLELFYELFEQVTQFFSTEKITSSVLTSHSVDNLEWWTFSGQMDFNDKSIYEVLDNHKANFMKLKIDESFKGTILKKHLKGFAKSIIPAHANSWEAIVAILLNSFGEFNSNFNSIIKNHKAIGQIPSKIGATNETWMKIAEASSKHFTLIKRAEHLATYSDSIKRDLIHYQYVSVITEILPAETYYNQFRKSAENPANAYFVVRSLIKEILMASQRLAFTALEN